MWCSAARAIRRRSGDSAKQRSKARSASLPRPSIASALPSVNQANSSDGSRCVARSRKGRASAGAALLYEQMAEILVGLRECRSLGDHLAKQIVRFGSAIQLDEKGAEQRLQVDVARVFRELRTRASLRLRKIARVDERDHRVEVGLGCGERSHWVGERFLASEAETDSLQCLADSIGHPDFA